MMVWVLAPFLALVLADAISKRWPVLVRTTLYCLMLVLTLGSLAVYINDALRPRKAQAAFVFVAVPLVSWIVIAVAVAVAALVSRRRSR
jgi:biotin transporter BioY